VPPSREAPRSAARTRACSTWIDGKPIVDNDGIHGTDGGEATIALDRGPHDIRVWYFQGPATEVSLQLFVGPPGGAERIFAMGDFAPGLAAAAKKLDALQAVSEMIRAYPNAVTRAAPPTPVSSSSARMNAPPDAA